MSTKRILAAVLGTLMLVALAVPAFAYSTPYAELQMKSFYTSLATISGSSANFDLFGGTSCAPATKTAAISVADGAWHLTNTTTGNTAYATGAKGQANTSNAYSQFVDNTKGMTVDLYAKFNELPVLATNQQLTDFGVTSGNPDNLYFSGLVFNICSAEKYMADTSKANNELQAVFAFYDNEELGTNAALILPYGNRNAFASASAVTYFFDLPTDYARYTLKFDAVNKTTNFYINGEEQYFDGGDEATFNGIALCYRANATTNFININLNNAQAAVKDNGGTTDFYLDQMNIYPAALTPADDFLFEEEPAVVANANFTNAYNYYRDFAPMADEYFNPTFWNAFEGFINKGLELIAAGDQEALNAHADAGTNGTWFINRFHFKTTAGINAVTGGSDVTVNGTGTVIPAATPVLLGYDKFYVSHIDADGVDTPWSYSSVLVTAAGLDPFNIKSFGGNMSAAWRCYTFEPTHVEDVYKLIDVGGLNAARGTVIPEGGFTVVFHTNSKTNTTANTAAAEYNKYNSGLFWARNVHAIYAAGKNGGSIGKNLYYKFTGLDLAAGTIDTKGTWLTYKDAALDGKAGDHVYRDGYVALAEADAEGRTTGTRDKFVGFKSNTFFQYYADELPALGEAINVTVKGEGTVSATVNGNAAAIEGLVAADGDTVVLTANGEGFKYWIGGNDAIVSTDATLTVKGGKALNFIAVFEDAAAETYNVYFKDSKTGRVWATKSVAAGTALDTTDVTAALQGYTFAGWDVENGTIINATTEVYAKYTKNTSGIDVTIIDGARNSVTNRAYGSVLAVTARGDNFSYWTLNDVIVSTDADFRFNTPATACTLKAVYGEEAPAAVAAVVDLSKDGDTFYFLMSRAVKAGTIKETGVLMSRKADAAALTVDTTEKTVTRGISTASDEYDVVGFVKDATGKAGTWNVRGYVTYELEGTTYTVYTAVASIVIG